MKNKVKKIMKHSKWKFYLALWELKQRTRNFVAKIAAQMSNLAVFCFSSTYENVIVSF